MVRKVPPYVMPDVTGGLDAAEAKRIAGFGFNTVRLGVAFSGIMPRKGVIDRSYLEQVSRRIALLDDHGIHVLLDLHQDLYAPPWVEWYGFPRWAVPLHIPIAQAFGGGTIPTILAGLGLSQPAVAALLAINGGPTIGDLAAAEPPLQFPLGAVRPSHALTWDFFWGDGKLSPSDPKGVLSYLTDALGALAAHVADDAGVLGIEFMNEPFPGTVMAECMTHLPVPCLTADRVLIDTYRRFTDRIRQAAGPGLPVWWEVNVAWNFLQPTSFGAITQPRIDDPQLGITHHDYSVCGTVDLQDACDVHHNRNFSNHRDLVARTERPILSTEFGFTTNAIELERFLSRADTAMLGWHYWDYGNAHRNLPERFTPFTDEQLDVLVRTYPQATAGTPREFSFDSDSGLMRYRYEPSGSGASTDIFVSNRHYAQGYEVVVTGAAVTSAPCARHLTLVADDDAAEVNVIVRDGRC